MILTPLVFPGLAYYSMPQAALVIFFKGLFPDGKVGRVKIRRAGVLPPVADGKTLFVFAADASAK